MRKDIAIFMMENKFFNEVESLTDCHIRSLVESLTAMAKYGNYSSPYYRIEPDALTIVDGGGVNISITKKVHVKGNLWEATRLTMWFESMISKSTYKIKDLEAFDYMTVVKHLKKDFMSIKEEE